MFLVLLALACTTTALTGSDAGSAADTEPFSDTDGADPECPSGTADCDADASNGCETTGCCHPYDSAGNALTDCDGDGWCECYGACGADDECVGE